MPVSESLRVSVGSSSCDDEGEDDNADNDENLETGQPKLKFTKESDTEVVDAENADEEYGDPNTWVDSISRQPELDDQCGSGQLIRRDDDIFQPVTI